MDDSEKQNGRTTTHPETATGPAGRTFWNKLPPWVTSNLRSRKSWKMLVRCWAASWVCLVIMLPNKSLATLGNTAFFALLVSVMVPPNMPVQIFIFTLSTLVAGLLLGWGIGCAAMRGALAARNQLLLKESLQKEAESAAGLANPDALFRADIFQGKFLDTRSTIVFGCFFGLAISFFGLIRAYVPKLMIMSVFGTIAVDIFCSFGPLFPFAQYTILNSLLTSVACYIAIALIFIICVFPETMNHSYLDSTSELIGKFKGLIDMQKDVLASSPQDLSPGSPLVMRIQGARAAVIQHLHRLTAQKGFLNLELSWGRWNGDDIIELMDPLFIVASRISALNSFAKLLGHPLSMNTDGLPHTDTDSSTGTASGSAGDTLLLRQFREHSHTAEAEFSVRIVDVLPVIEEATLELREACSAALAATQALVVCVNTKRYKRGGTEAEQHLQDVEEASANLRHAMEAFKQEKRLLLLEPFQSVFAAADTMKMPPMRSLYAAYVFAANLMTIGSGILVLSDAISTTARRRTHTRLWLPKGLRAIGKLLRSRGQSGDRAVGEETMPEEGGESEREEQSYKRDPDSRPPTNVMQRLASFVHKALLWCRTPEALFTFKYVIVSIALWIPSVVRTSAHFVYAERGVWALIMAQTTLNIYASDQIFNYVMRIGGTFVGAVVSMLCWYIGAGHGTGNPYGLATITAVILLPLMFLRIFAPPEYLIGILLSGATFALIVGYSWIDGNLPGIFGSVGFGWSVAWRRWVLVMIGCAASFIMMLLPATSGRKAVRLRNATTIAGLSYLYSHLMSIWLDKELSPSDDPKNKPQWIVHFRERSIGVAEQIQDLKVRTVMSKWEGSIRGTWAFEEYNNLATVQSDILASLTLLGGSLIQLDPELRVAFHPHTSVLNPHFISDVISIFFLVSQSLRTGEPLHQAQYQNLSDRLHYHGEMANSASKGSTTGPRSLARQEHLRSITSYEYMFYATAVVAVLQMAQGLNELRKITAELCGEVPLHGPTTTILICN
ncbi:Uncharacterized protein C57A7.05 [Grifola frondosa]|uniref:Uncharacterized protein C57A7.05 n=1 Tax=Grifola frondosa TaxID=5627 RepID=A0A1C7MLY3_GRIFR|nr:Uncharacterized protein C57A7.05 [Grifola frondosa]